jgi:hypothetical protein
METKITQPKQPRRNRRSTVSAVLFWLSVVACLAVVALWQMRVAVVTRVVRGALDRQGLADVTFALRQLTPGHVVVEDIRVGMPAPVLAIDRVDVRFSFLEVLQRHVERVTVSGVRTRLTMGGGQVSSPLADRLKPLLDAQSAGGCARPPKAAQAVFTLGAGTLQNARVAVLLAGGGVLTTLRFDAGLLSEPAARPSLGLDGTNPRLEGERPREPPPACYRVWGSVCDEALIQAKVEGTVDSGTGAVSLTPELKILHAEKIVEWARAIAPQLAVQIPVFPTNGTLAVRGSVALQSWTNVGPFEVSAELGRGSEWMLPGKDTFVRFQSFRVEASGTPRDMQCRVSAGVSGFKAGGQLQASQEEGRLLSLRGTARFRQTATNQWVTAALDSDLPGRAVAQVLPRILPLVPVFFSEGGTLHLETDVTRLPQAQWNGGVSLKAEASRSSAPLTAGRVGAGTVRVLGTVAIVDAKPGVIRTEIKLADGYFYRRDLSVRGGADATLTAHPPYETATGTFRGHVSESVALPQSSLSFDEGSVPFEGEAVVTGLASNPVWQVALRMPETGVVSTQQTAGVRATVGAKASVRYGAASLAVEGDAWVRDVAVQVGPESNRVAEAGVSRITAQVTVPAFNPAHVSNARVGVTLSVSNGWARAGTLAVLEDVRVALPLAWSPERGLSFLPEQSLTWRRLEAQGLKVEPDRFAVAAEGKSVVVRFGAHVAGSRLGVTLKAAVPLADPRQMVVDMTVTEAEIATDDALAGVVRDKAKGAEFSGRVSAEAQLLFWGTHPRIVGRVRLADGQVRKDKLSVEGLSADVPFQKGISFRTIDRPVVSFMRAKAGNVCMDQGRLAFQLTEKELFVDRMEVGWCKGSLNAYSVHLALKNPKDDFIVYADRIDLGEALMMVVPFKGLMQGVLYGRFPVGFDKGHVKLSKGFLYSLPGQDGKLKLNDNAQMAELLGKAGIKGDIQAPLSRALSDMDFSTFKMDLEPGQKDEGTLRIKLAGKSNDKEWPAPVDLTLNLHGPLEELLNMGLNVSRK